MEELRRAILSYMVDDLTSDQLHKLEVAIDYSFNDYDITKKSRELAVYDDKSLILLKNFLGAKLMSGASEETIKQYRDCLLRLRDDIGTDFNKMTTSDIRQHLARWQVERNVSRVTLDYMRRVYTSFFNWLEVEEYIEKSPMKRIEAIKTEKKQIEPFNEKELEKLFSACDNVRDHALLVFLYTTGVRASECSRLNINDIDFVKGEFMVRLGKGSKDRPAYISEACSVWLEKYLETRTDNEEALFISKNGRLSKRGIEYIVKRIGDRAGVENAHPHRFRHAFATDLIKRGASVTAVQELLGHTNINTTMNYVKIGQDEAKYTHKKLLS